jgi:hypothetical protein
VWLEPLGEARKRWMKSRFASSVTGFSILDA